MSLLRALGLAIAVVTPVPGVFAIDCLEQADRHRRALTQTRPGR